MTEPLGPPSACMLWYYRAPDFAAVDRINAERFAAEREIFPHVAKEWGGRIYDAHEFTGGVPLSNRPTRRPREIEDLRIASEVPTLLRPPEWVQLKVWLQPHIRVYAYELDTRRWSARKGKYVRTAERWLWMPPEVLNRACAWVEVIPHVAPAA